MIIVIIIMNQESLVNACQQRALNTSLPFVHTARRTYRLNGPMNTLDFSNVSLNGLMIIERSCVNLTI